MSVSIDTGGVSAAPPPESDLNLIYQGGQNFLARMAALSDARDKSERALLALAIGNDAKAAYEDAKAKSAEAMALLEKAKADRAYALNLVAEAKEKAGALVADAQAEARATSLDIEQKRMAFAADVEKSRAAIATNQAELAAAIAVAKESRKQADNDAVRSAQVIVAAQEAQKAAGIAKDQATAAQKNAKELAAKLGSMIGSLPT